LRIAKTVVMLTQEDRDPKKQRERSPGGLAAPQMLGGTTTIFEFYVDDVDKSCMRRRCRRYPRYSAGGYFLG